MICDAICPKCGGCMIEEGDGFDSELICEECGHELIRNYDTGGYSQYGVYDEEVYL